MNISPIQPVQGVSRILRRHMGYADLKNGIFLINMNFIYFFNLFHNSQIRWFVAFLFYFIFLNYLHDVLKKITYSLSLCFGQIPVSQNECFAAILWHPKAIINLCGICQLHFPYSWRGSGEHRCGLSRLLFQLQQFLETKHLFFFFSSLVHLFPVCSLRH